MTSISLGIENKAIESKAVENKTADATSAIVSPVMVWLRLEGLAIAVLAAILYARTGASWGLFAVLWLMPDLSFLAYLAGPRWGSYGYNAVHSYLLPSALATIAMVLHFNAALPFAFIWFNHIGVDRLLGYGLKYPTGFGHTHLNQIGRERTWPHLHR